MTSSKHVTDTCLFSLVDLIVLYKKDHRCHYKNWSFSYQTHLSHCCSPNLGIPGGPPSHCSQFNCFLTAFYTGPVRWAGFKKNPHCFCSGCSSPSLHYNLRPSEVHQCNLLTRSLSLIHFTVCPNKCLHWRTLALSLERLNGPSWNEWMGQKALKLAPKLLGIGNVKPNSCSWED